MRHGMPLAIPWLIIIAGFLPAQERIPLPAPDPFPPELLPPPLPSPSSQTQAPPTDPSQSYTPPPVSTAPEPSPIYPPQGPYTPNPPSPGLYPPPPAPPVFVPNPIKNPNFWLGVEGLVWWTKNQPLPVPIVTTGPAYQGANAGNLGMPDTTSLDSPLNYGAVGGIRVFAGGWFTIAHTIGMDGSLFILGQQSAGFSVIDRSGVGNLVINEPVSGSTSNTQVSAPGVESGSVVVAASTRFGGGDINLLYNLYRGNDWTINLLGGYRYLELDESLNISANSNLFVDTQYTDNMGNVLANAPPGSSVTVIDQFGTRNQFNGGQIGAQLQYQWQRLFISGSAKLGIGNTHEIVTVGGNTTVFPVNGSPVLLTGGNYATLQIGRYSTDRFALAPAAQLNIGYQLAPCIRAQIGYDFLYMSSVVRPGNQIDNSYDGVTHPLVPMTSSSFWAQGLTLGLRFSF